MPPTDRSPTDDDLSPSEERLWVLVDRYLAGDAEAHEAGAVRAWLAVDQSRSELLHDVRRIREVAGSGPRLRAAEDAWAALIPGLADKVARPAPLHRTRRALPAWSGMRDQSNTDAWPRRITTAAAMLLVAALATYGRWGGSRPGGTSIGRATSASAPAHVFSTTRGQRAEIRLVDGTRVILAADSRLTLSTDYGVVRRLVALEGEAYFDVQHDSLRPFAVSVAHAVVHDLGTRFDVRAYPSDPGVLVVVVQGSVRMVGRAATDSVGRVSGRGVAVRMNAAGQLSMEPDVDTTRYLAWTRGRLVFAAAPLTDVATEIGRWYDVEIVIPDSTLAARRLTATIEDQPLSHVLDQLSVALELRAARMGRRVTLTPLPKRTRMP